MPERIQRRRVKRWQRQEGIYVGRGSKWGNPFTVERWGRVQSIAMYRAAIDGGNPMWLGLSATDYIAWEIHSRILREWVALPGMTPRESIRRELRGKDLACWCPLYDKRNARIPCHADVLLEVANA